MGTTTPEAAPPAERLGIVDLNYDTAARVAEIVQALGMPLDRGRVKQKPGGGSFDYLPHADVRKHANDLFGYLGWGYTVDDLTCVATGPLTSKDGKDGFQAAYTCRVTFELYVGDRIIRKGGVGGGESFVYTQTDAAAATACHANAAKEAESDALKRALINLGDQFGLILYAKDEATRWEAQAQARAVEARPIEERQQERRAKWEADGIPVATPNEVAAVEVMAAAVDAETAEKTAAAIDDHRAAYDGLVNGTWLGKLAAALLRKGNEKIAAAGSGGTFPDLVPAEARKTLADPASHINAEEVRAAFAT